MKKAFSIVMVILTLSCNKSMQHRNKQDDLYQKKYPNKSAIIKNKSISMQFFNEKNKLKIKEIHKEYGKVLDPEKFSDYQIIPYSKTFEKIKILSARTWGTKYGIQKVRKSKKKNRLTSAFYSNQMAKTFHFPKIEKNMDYEIIYEKTYLDNNSMGYLNLIENSITEKLSIEIENLTDKEISLKLTGDTSFVNFNKFFQKVEAKKKKILMAQNVPDYKSFENQSLPREVIPSLHIFIDDSSTTSSFKELSNYYYNLNKENYSIPDSLYQKLLSELPKTNSDDEFVTELFSYIQKNIRYESLSEGIKAYQAFSPSEVLDLKYGDCKGVSMLLVSILNKKGIEAYPVILDAGVTGYNLMYPKIYMANHVIAYVKTAQKNYWLDATSSYINAEKILYHNSDRNVIVVKGLNSFEYLKTPKYDFRNDFFNWKFDFEIKNSMLHGKGEIQLSGINANTYRRFIHEKSTSNIESLLKNKIESFLENSFVKNLKIKNLKKLSKPLIISFDIKYKNSVSELSDGKLITLNPVSHMKNTVFTTKNVVGHFYLNSPFNESIEINLKKSSDDKLSTKFSNKTFDFLHYTGSFKFSKKQNELSFFINQSIKTNKVFNEERPKFYKSRKKIRRIFDIKLKLKENK
jgi:hypothetical protein